MMSKTKNKNLAQVFHYDLYGKREEKYDFLNENSINSIDWKELDYKEPYYFFVPKDFKNEDKYKKGIKLNELFEFNNSGFETAKDKFIIKNSKEEIDNLKKDISENTIEELVHLFNEKERKLQEVKNDIENSYPIKALYRPFDLRYTLISKNSQGVMFRPRFDTVKHLLKDNIGLLCCKRQTSFDFQHTFITKNAVERCSVSLQTGEVSYVFPLYLYPNKETEGVFAEEGLSEKGRKPNLNPEIVQKIADKLKLPFVSEKDNSAVDPVEIAPIDILDYIYAVLHSPTYREKYKEFLKIDFPRVPYPKDAKTFWQLVKLGGEIRQIHLLESPKVEEYITQYPEGGENKITTKIAKKDWVLTNETTGRIYINETQYFDNIPLEAWEFFIGGYQPAQKWLKDRAPKKGQEGRILTYDDILHYQKIIVALTETDRLMKEIDGIEIE